MFRPFTPIPSSLFMFIITKILPNDKQAHLLLQSIFSPVDFSLCLASNPLFFISKCSFIESLHLFVVDHRTISYTLPSFISFDQSYFSPFFFNMTDLLDVTFVNPIIYSLFHTKTLYQCVHYFVYSPYTSLLYIKTGKRNLPNSNCILLAFASDLIASTTILPLATFLRHSAPYVPESSNTYFKHLNSETCSSCLP